MAWQLDPTHTQIGFSVKHMMLTTVRGQFNAYTAAVDLDEAQAKTWDRSIWKKWGEPGA